MTKEDESQEQPREALTIDNGGDILNDVRQIAVTESGKRVSAGDGSDSGGGDGDDDLGITAKLSKLSLQERTQGIHEVHGVADFPMETPEMIKSKLQEISNVAESYGENEQTVPYRKALEMNKEYVEGIQLLSLRATNYDCDKAAARLVSYFALKKNFFGVDKLGKVIVYNDLDPDDQRALKNGLCQLLQQRDRAGRAVILAMGRLSSDYSMETICRVHYYMIMAAVRDEAIQKSGVVLIYNLIGQTQFYEKRPAQFAKFLWYLPVRLVSVHSCRDNNLLTVALKLFADAIEGHFLCRYRGHVGNDLECMFSLMTFGIPRDMWPIDLETGELKLEAHHEWIEAMRNKEKAQYEAEQAKRGDKLDNTISTPSAGIVVPSPMDIIMGGGKNSKSSMGYLRLRGLVEKYHEAYDDSERIEKVAIASIVLRDLHGMGCRFVKNTPTGLEILTDTAAIAKISHAFRNYRVTAKTKGRGTGMAKRQYSDT